MSVRKKINIGFITIELLALLSLGFATLQFFYLDNKVEKAIDKQVVQLQLAQSIESNLANQGMYAFAYISNLSEENFESLSYYNDKLTTDIKELSTTAHSTVMQDYASKLTSSHEIIQNHISQITKFGKGSEEIAAQYMLNNEYIKTKEAMSGLTANIIEYQQNELTTISNEVKNSTFISSIVKCTL